MAPPDYARVKALFNEVCDLPGPSAQRQRLAELAATDEERERVLALLEEDAKTRSAASVTQHVVAAVNDLTQELRPGDRLGAFTLVRELGHGGMGQVFLAERSDGHYQQRVAIKLLIGAPGPEAQALLARERQILASLNHPHIARLLDGGTTPRGRPYLVMEFVDGIRIDEHCEARSLGLSARLQLFRQVCEAVAEAHRQLIVHCDLKPGNVLVDDQGRAKLLDFGIARLPGQDAAGEHSSVGHTPRYASPEQQAGQGATVSSDIFSLGRILGELLEGLPRPERRDELRAVVAKATATEPGARYPSVDALLAELRRFEAHRPLQARQGQPGYALAKLLRRRWPWALVGAGVLAGSAAFTVSLVEQRQTAEREAETARQVSAMLVGLFEGADPSHGGRPDMSARELVDRGRERVRADLSDRPAVQASMLAVLGQVYRNLGRPKDGITLLEEATHLPGTTPQQQVDALILLSNTYADATQDAKAEQVARRALALARSLPVPLAAEAVANAQAALGRALTLTGAFAEARQQILAAKASREARHGREHLLVATSLEQLGRLARAEGKTEEGIPFLTQALEIRRRLERPDDPHLLNTLQNLAGSLNDVRRPAEALPLIRDVLAARRQQLGDDNDAVANTWSELGNTLQDAGQTREAIAAYREALRIDEKVTGRREASVAVRINNLATALEEVGDPEAEARYRESLSVREEKLPAGDIVIARARANLGRYLMRQGQLAEARAALEKSLQERLAKLPADHFEVTDTRLSLGEVALAQGRRADADAQIALLKPLEPKLRPAKRALLQRLWAIEAAQDGDIPTALRLQAQATEALQPLLPAGHPVTLRAQLEWVERLLAAGDLAAAREKFAGLHAGLERQDERSALRAYAARLQQRLENAAAAKG
jgi:serine/threonine-protein kinase